MIYFAELQLLPVMEFSFNTLPQVRIQTTSTYASAEVTSAVVKLLEKQRNTRFLLQIILFFSSADRKDWNVFGRGMP